MSAAKARTPRQVAVLPAPLPAAVTELLKMVNRDCGRAIVFLHELTSQLDSGTFAERVVAERLHRINSDLAELDGKASHILSGQTRQIVQPASDNVVDLMEGLKRSLARHRKAGA